MGDGEKQSTGSGGSTAGADTGATEIVQMDRAATPTEHLKYPSETVIQGDVPFDGSYTQTIGYRSKDRKFVVGVFESGPGVLESAAYPNDEYCLVLEGHLIVTNHGGRREEFGPGDTLAIPKGWAGTWNMTTRFKKRFVALEEAPESMRRHVEQPLDLKR